MLVQIFNITFISFTLILSTTTVSFGAVSGEPIADDFQEELLETILLPDDTIVEDQSDCEMIPYDNSGITTAANFKKSAGTGKATVQATKYDAKKMTSKIQLQELAPRTGEFINSSAKAATASKAGNSIAHTATFSLLSSKTYRVKITITASVGEKTFQKLFIAV